MLSVYYVGEPANLHNLLHQSVFLRGEGLFDKTGIEATFINTQYFCKRLKQYKKFIFIRSCFTKRNEM